MRLTITRRPSHYVLEDDDRFYATWYTEGFEKLTDISIPDGETREIESIKIKFKKKNKNSSQ